MIYRRIFQVLLPVFLFFLLLVQSACEKFSGDQTIPAYLSIDSIALQINDPGVEGSASHNITDAWVFIDDNSIGAYQLPAHFPVLKEGKHKLTIFAGIKKDGIAATRVTYPFYAQVERNINLVPDSTLEVGLLKTAYESTSKFTWKENFEDVSMSMDTTRQSSVKLEETPSGSPLTFEGSHSGMIRLDTTHNFFEVVTHNQFPIPVSVPVYLEMNFNSSISFNVGVFIYASGYVIYQVPILTLVPTNGKWKKIYIDLSVSLNAYTGAQHYKVYLANFANQGITNALVLFDNFKVVTR